MDKRKVILDVDTGADDAVAIMLALLAPELEVIGICSVNGNREAVSYTHLDVYKRQHRRRRQRIS